MAKLNSNFNGMQVKDILWGILFAVACILVQHSSDFLGYCVSYPVEFKSGRNGEGGIVGDIKFLTPANYYISIGNRRDICDLYIDDNKVDSNRSEISGVQNKLFIGAGFVVQSQGSVRKIFLKCDSQAGFGGVTHKPVVASFFWGTVLQTWRQVLDLLLCPIVAILIILSAFGRRRRKIRPALEGSKGTAVIEGWDYFLFGVVSLCYSVSLIKFTRLFIPGLPASNLHIILRNIFSIAVLILFTPNRRIEKIFIGIQILLVCVVSSVAYFTPLELISFYHWEYLFCPFSCAVLTYIGFQREATSKSIVILRRLLLAWTILQILDGILLWTGIGAYSAPSLILLLSASAFYLRNLEWERANNVENAVENILSVIESNTPINDVLREVALITMREAKYGRVSSYIDGFCVGSSESPGKQFFRVSEQGYKKDTTMDSVISFSEGRGAIMAEALKTQKPVLRTGLTDGAWFLVVPVGSHACVNLSDDSPKSNFLAYESLEIIERIFLSLLSLERRLIDLGFQQGAALQKLKSKRGDGRWEEEFGAIFVDINDYSQLADTFGESFTGFISDVYIPAFIKAVSKNSVSEHVAGDEIYFIVTQDLLQDGLSLRKGVLDTLNSIDSFVSNEGLDLCASAGFTPVTTSIGISVGAGTIISDSVSVRTSGKLVNHAKRLQEEAGKAGILVSFDSKLDFSSTNYVVGEEFFIQKKKQIVRALKVLRRAIPVTKFGNVGT